MNEKPDVKYRVTEEGVQALCRTQKDILDAVAPMVKVGGTLVYSTCSILPQENERADQGVSGAPSGVSRSGRWRAELPEKLAAHESACGLQMFAHRDGTDGFYRLPHAQGEGVMSGMDKTQLLGMTPDELTVYFKQLGQPAFRARQVFAWLHQGADFDADEQPAQGACAKRLE